MFLILFHGLDNKIRDVYNSVLANYLLKYFNKINGAELYGIPKWNDEIGTVSHDKVSSLQPNRFSGRE